MIERHLQSHYNNNSFNKAIFQGPARSGYALPIQIELTNDPRLTCEFVFKEWLNPSHY